MPRNTTIASRPRFLPGSEDGDTREQFNLLVTKFGVLCDTLDADAGVTTANFAATQADAADAPSLVGGTNGTFVPSTPAPGVGVATQLAFVQQPAVGTSALALNTIIVEARSASGVRVTDFTGTITLAIDSQAAGPGSTRDVILRATAPGLVQAVSTAIRVSP